MADKSKIEWTDATWNIVTGCSVVSPACTNCYAMRIAGTRLAHHPSRAGLTREVNGKHVWTGEVRFNKSCLPDPIKWKRPRKIFIAAHGDLFHDAVSDEQRDLIFAVMALCPHHTFQILTKRPARMRKYISGESWKIPMLGAKPLERVHLAAAGHMEGDGGALDALKEAGNLYSLYLSVRWPLPNVWLGVTAEDQRRADERIPDLLATPAAVRFVSVEPMLGSLNLNSALGGTLWIGGQRGCGGTHKHDGPAEGHDHGEDIQFVTGDPRRLHHHHDARCGRGLDWVICGGESGPGARPMHPDWGRGLRDQCVVAGVPFFFKQHGEWIGVSDLRNLAGGSGPGFGVYDHYQYDMEAEAVRVGKARAGRLLDGREHNEFPEPRR